MQVTLIRALSSALFGVIGASLFVLSFGSHDVSTGTYPPGSRAVDITAP